MKIIFFLLALLAVNGYSQAPFIFKSYDLNPGSGFSTPSQFVNFNGKYFFGASTPATGGEVWVGDTSASGPQLFKDIRPGAAGSYPLYFCVSGNKLFFYADDGVNGIQIWVSDGTSIGTKMVSASGMSPYSPDRLMFAWNGKILFGGTTVANGRELWISDGTDTGTKMIKDIYTGSHSSDPANFTAFNGKVYFSAANAAYGNELWVTDGTAGGTSMVKDIDQYTLSSYPANFCVFGPKFYFSAATWNYGGELWMSDGTDTGTKMVKDIFPGVNGGMPSLILPFNGKMYFSAGDSSGEELWTSDGTVTGTAMVKDINLGGYGSSPLYFTEYNSKVYFQATDTNGAELWVTDGTAAGTKMVKDIQPGANGSVVSKLFVYKKRLYFRASATGTDLQLMYTDGTTLGTQMIAPASAFKTAPLINAQFFMYPGDSSMYFCANYDNISEELWSLTDTTTYPPAPPPSPCDSPHVIHFTHIGVDSAIIDWDTVAGASHYEYYIILYGNSTPGGSMIMNDTLTALGLAANTKYQFCVRTVCGSLTSGWHCDTFRTASIATFIEQSVSGGHISLHPNPATGVFTIDVPAGIKNGVVTIVNMYGQVVTRKEIANTADWKFDLGGIAKGIYTVEIKHDGELYRGKIMLQ